MATLDGDFGHIEESSVPFIPTAIRVGVIGAIISIIYQLIGFLTGMSNPGAGVGVMAVFGIVGMVIAVGIIVFAIRKHRNEELGGHISFGRAFLVGLIASVVASIIGMIFQYIYIEFIDPGYVETMVEGMEEMMSGFGLPEEDVEKALEDTRAGLAPSKMFTSGLLTGVAVSAVIALICAAIMKKEPSQA